MDNGWICLHRKIIKWEWFKKDNMYRVFTYLVLSANHEDGKWEGQEIMRGQLITGRKKIAEDVGVSEQSVRTCLSLLKSTNEITIKSTSKYSLITIIKYEDYQRMIKKSTNKSTNKLTNNQPTTNQQLTTNNNINNITTKQIKQKDIYGEFQNVFLAKDEYKKLIDTLKEDKTKEMIERLSGGIESKGYKYKSHYATILNWVRKDEKENKQNINNLGTRKTSKNWQIAQEMIAEIEEKEKNGQQ